VCAEVELRMPVPGPKCAYIVATALSTVP
jgi:hypothetical protein